MESGVGLLTCVWYSSGRKVAARVAHTATTTRPTVAAGRINTIQTVDNMPVPIPCSTVVVGPGTMVQSAAQDQHAESCLQRGACRHVTAELCHACTTQHATGAALLPPLPWHSALGSCVATLYALCAVHMHTPHMCS